MFSLQWAWEIQPAGAEYGRGRMAQSIAVPPAPTLAASSRRDGQDALPGRIHRTASGAAHVGFGSALACGAEDRRVVAAWIDGYHGVFQ